MAQDIDINTLREYSDLVRNKLETSFTILLSKYQDKNIIVTAATDSAVEKGINCGIIVMPNQLNIRKCPFLFI